jgi:uncharacterized metal-binding protein YceD (DUF177 family)
MKPELHRPIAIERVGSAGLNVTVEADATECAAVAVRMQLPAVLALTCDYHLTRDTAGALLAHGRLVARVVQTCVISLEEFTADIDERFTVRCVASGEENEQPDPMDLDEIVHEGGELDLGEAMAEQLALALDPYPRAPYATLPELDDAPEPSAFSALSSLKRPH